MQVELTPDEYAALQELGREREQERQHAEYLRRPLGPNRSEVIARLADEGIVVGQHHHCWLRLRPHRFRPSREAMRIFFYSGSRSYGYVYTLCLNCGHARKTMACGGAARSALG